MCDRTLLARFLSRVNPAARLVAIFAGVTLASSTNTLAAEPYRVFSPSGGTPSAAVLLVPGCSGFVATNGVNLYEERAGELQAAGYLVVFVDYLARRNLTDCGGGRDVSRAEIGSDILEAAA